MPGFGREQVVGMSVETTADARFPTDVSGSVRTAALRCGRRLTGIADIGTTGQIECL
ncbi:hypothetical protein GFS60_08097 (plasmid) [Rhodococcus sp. WAY2]|nr:hypothetical protein GFS60_08097 [Rhodococcus sp. WAY2]